MRRILYTLMLLPTLLMAKTESVVLTEQNHFAVKSEFNETLLDDFAKKVYGNKEKTLYVYFDSPGGSVVSLARMLGVMKQAQNSGVNFVCIARFAASAAFLLFQQCNERLLFEDGILMSHDASGRFGGEIARVEKKMNLILQLMKVVSMPAANKMGLSYEDYRALTVNELWLTSINALDYKAIDNTITNVTCDKELLSKKKSITVEFFTFFGMGKANVLVSACPLIGGEEETASNHKQYATEGLRL